MPVLEDVFSTDLVDLWYDQQEEYDTEMERTRVNISRFSHVRQLGTSDDNLGRDMAVSTRIYRDLESVVLAVESGQKFPAKRFEDMLFVFSIANHALSCDNDALDSAFGVGIARLFVMLPWAVLKARATRMKKSLEELEKLLRQAEREQTQAWAQLGINAAITGVMIALGPTNLLIIGSVAIGQMVIDTAIGADTSAAATWGSRGNSTSGVLASAVENAEKAGKTTKSLAKGGGKALIVVGFVFDANEISVAYANKAAIEAAMKKADDELKELQKEIALNRAKINAFLTALKVWEKNMQDLDEWVVDVRVDLANAMQSTGYSPS